MKIKLKTIVSISSLLLVVGCSSPGTTTTSKVAIISNDMGAKEAENKLADAALEISDSLHQLAEVERAVHPQAKLPSPPAAEIIGMNQLASVEWTGPVGPLVDKIAKSTSYKLRVLGKPPAIPILVSISAKDTPLADILRD